MPRLPQEGYYASDTGIFMGLKEQAQGPELVEGGAEPVEYTSG